MATTTDLRNAALEYLTIRETIEAEDAALVDRVVTNVLDGFAQDGFAIPAIIPAYIFEELKRIVASEVASAFEMPQEDVTMAKAMVRNRLGMLMPSEPIRTDYY